MNWDAISAISESIGAVIVVVSLIYVATQIKFAKLAAADVSRHLRSNGVREMGLAMAANPDLRANWMAAGRLDKDYERLAERLGVNVDGAVQLDWIVTSWVWLHWGQYHSTTTKADINELEHLIGVFYSMPPISTIWKYGPYPKGLADEQFANFVETAVSKYGINENTENAA